VFYDTLIWRLPLDGDLQKQGLASRSECANLGAGGRRFKSGRPDHQLAPVTLSCSHEHSGFAETVSVSAQPLVAVVIDVAESLRVSGIDRLAIVNGHGGNYVLANVVQQANTAGPRMTLFPSRSDWDVARTAAGLSTTASQDMHAGDLEVSLPARRLAGRPAAAPAGDGHARLHRDRGDWPPIAGRRGEGTRHPGEPHAVLQGSPCAAFLGCHRVTTPTWT
jgi:hypothetical protein